MKGPLRPWTNIANPKKRRDYPFPEELRRDCDKYYVDNYIRWCVSSCVETIDTELYTDTGVQVFNGAFCKCQWTNSTVKLVGWPRCTSTWGDRQHWPAHLRATLTHSLDYRWLRFICWWFYALCSLSRDWRHSKQVLPPLSTSLSTTYLHLHDW